VAGPADALEETDLADQLALVIQREVAEGHAVVIAEEDLEELDLVDDEHAAAAQGPPPAVPPAAAAMVRGINRVVAWSTAAMGAVRAKAAAARASRTELAAAPAARIAAAPPAPLAALSVVPLARNAAPAARARRVRLAGLAAAVLAVAAAAGLALARWGGSGDARTAAPPPTAPPPAPPSEPQFAPGVAAAAERLPHLAPATVQVLIATSPFANPEPPDVFRRARAALRKGLPSLSPEEAQELAVLERALLVRLSPPERERVMAYDRLRAGRDLVPAEDARVMTLVARGALSLPSEHRARLQVLSARAIAAGLEPSSPQAAAAR
jgi:hypothetical protein